MQHFLLTLTLLIIATVSQNLLKDDDDIDECLTPSQIITHQIPNYELIIQLYDGHHIEIQIVSVISGLSYSTNITKTQYINEFDIATDDQLINIINSSVDSNTNSNDASYDISLNDGNNILIFQIKYRGYVGKQNIITLLLHLNNPTFEHHTQIITKLSTQIYELNAENRKLKDTINELSQKIDALTDNINIFKPRLLPQFSIIIWDKCNDIPENWVLCDGTHNTPDLRARFIVGLDNNEFKANQKGGSNHHKHNDISINAKVHDHKLSIQQIPRHTHQAGEYKYIQRKNTIYTSNNHVIRCSGRCQKKPDIVHASEMSHVGGDEPHSHSITVDSARITNANHLPPYYAACYIMKI